MPATVGPHPKVRVAISSHKLVTPFHATEKTTKKTAILTLATSSCITDGESGEQSGFGLDLESGEEKPATPAIYSFAALSLSAFVITDAELKLMAAAAIIGFSSNPMNGYRTPAAKGTPSAL